METYYKIIEKGKNVEHGLILRLFLDKIECVAGEDFDKDGNKLLNGMNIVQDNSKIVSINNNYSFSEITEGNANVLISDWVHFLNIVAEGGYNPKTFWREM